MSNLPVPPQQSSQPMYLVVIPSSVARADENGKIISVKPIEYVPLTGHNTATWHFTLHEAVEIRERYIEKMQARGRRTSDPDELGLILALIRGVRIVPSVEH